MPRPTRVIIDPSAMLHNLQRIQAQAPGKNIIAMVKANAYGCGINSIIPVLEGRVQAFGVASIEEALAIRNLGSRTDCVLFQGVFNPDEYMVAANHHFQCVLHQAQHVQWLLNTPLPHAIKIWVKVDTGMHRLGFSPDELLSVLQAIQQCAWVNQTIGIMTHLACAEEPDLKMTKQQLACFSNLTLPPGQYIRSVANSAAIFALTDTHADVIRPGIMLYGVSPFTDLTGLQLGLKPVMHFLSQISAIHHYPPFSPIGYGGTWQSDKESTIGIIPVGYGDGYPRHIQQGKVWIKGAEFPIVGRISMDMLSVDLTHASRINVGDEVELWGKHMPIETVARTADTIPYELLTQLTTRPR